MAEAFFLRRILRSPAATAASKSGVFFKKQSYGAGAGAADKEENHSLNEKNGGKGKGKWMTLPPFTATLDAASLGKRITGGSNPVENSTSALKWVLHCCPQLPKSLVHKLFRLRQVRRECLEVGGSGPGAQVQEWRLKRVGAKELINEGERVFLPITVEGSPVKKHEHECSEEEMSFVRGLELYKDAAIIAINKPPKLAAQGGLGIKKSLDELAASCLRYDYKDPPRLVHRLDRDSSGILIMGRTRTSIAVLHSIFREKTIGISEDKDIDWGKRTLQKRYLALVFGVPKQLKGLISAPLAKVVMDDGKSERITVADRASSSQHAVTEYRVIETSTFGYTWLELSPLTGRKHQLRVHCTEVLGTPIVGDYKYGWQVHRRWQPLPDTKLSLELKTGDVKSHQLGLDLEVRSIAEKQPHLHLHCKKIIIPSISQALNNASLDSNNDFSQLETLNLVAPLPCHMQRSWNLLTSLAQLHNCK